MQNRIILDRVITAPDSSPFPWFLMMTSSNGNIFRVTGPLCGEFTGPGEIPAQRPVTRSFDVFLHLRLNKRLSKQPRSWWFETPPWSLRRQCNVLGIRNWSEITYNKHWKKSLSDSIIVTRQTANNRIIARYLSPWFEPIPKWSFKIKILK